MGLFDFLKGKNRDAPPFVQKRAAGLTARPESELLEEYPTAIELAKRHSDERNEPFRWLLTEQSPPPQIAASESPAAQSARHTEELKAAASSMPENRKANFQIAYSRASVKHSEAFTRAMEARVVRTDPEYLSRKDQARTTFNAYQRGEDVGSSFAAAIQKGVESGRLSSLTAESDRLEVITKQHAEKKAWLESVVDDERNICSELYDLGWKDGIQRGAQELVQQRAESEHVVSKKAVALDECPATTTLCDAKHGGAPVALQSPSFWDQQVGSIQFLAGSFGKGSGHLLASGKVRVPQMKDIPANAFANVEIASEESVKRIGGALGWGLAGGALLGPAGLLVGGLLGGRGKDVTFICTLSDGSRFLATAKSKVYTKLLAAAF